MLRAIFFDLDDTLCDTIGTREARARRAFAVLCATYPNLQIESLVSRALEPLGEPRSARGVVGVLQDLGLADSTAGRAALESIKSFDEPLKLFPGVIETIRLLARDYELAIVSNWPAHDEQLQKLIKLGLKAYIPHLVVSGAVGHEKPDPQIFACALSLVGVEPRESVFVGDRLDVDVASAKSAGMWAVWFNHWGGTITRDAPWRPDAAISRFQDLPGALGPLGAS